MTEVCLKTTTVILAETVAAQKNRNRLSLDYDCPWTGTRNKFQPELAFFLEPERFEINFSFARTGTGILKSQIDFE